MAQQTVSLADQAHQQAQIDKLPDKHADGGAKSHITNAADFPVPPTTDVSGLATKDDLLAVRTVEESEHTTGNSGNPAKRVVVDNANSDPATGTRQTSGNASLASIDSHIPAPESGRVPVALDTATRSQLAPYTDQLIHGPVTETNPGAFDFSGSDGGTAPTSGTGIRGWLRSLFTLWNGVISGGRVQVNSVQGADTISGNLTTVGTTVTLNVPVGMMTAIGRITTPAAGNPSVTVEVSNDGVIWTYARYVSVSESSGGGPSAIGPGNFGWPGTGLVNLSFSASQATRMQIDTMGAAYVRFRLVSAATSNAAVAVTLTANNSASSVHVASFPSAGISLATGAAVAINGQTIASVLDPTVPTALTAGQTYQSGGINLYYNSNLSNRPRYLRVFVATDQPGTLVLEQMYDGTNYRAIGSAPIPADGYGMQAEFGLMTHSNFGSYSYLCRIKVINNSSTAQTRLMVAAVIAHM